MDWIRVDVGLATHPKALDLAEILHEPLAWAYVVRLWGWAVSNAPAGVIRGINPKRTVETAAGWSGKPGKLADALLQVAFLDPLGDGSVALHDWKEHNGKALDHAKAEAQRLREYREQKRAESRKNRSATSKRTSTEHVQDEDGTRSKLGNETRRDETRRTKSKEEEGAAPPAAAFPASPASVASGASAPVPCPPGWEPLVRLERSTDGITVGAWCIPWFGNFPGEFDGPEPPTPEQALWSYFAIRVYGVTGKIPSVPSGKHLKRLRAALEQHSPEELRRAWLCWLTDAWAAGLNPPFALNAFLSDEQLPNMLSRAASAEWVPDATDVGDWELPEAAQEASHAP